MILRSDYLLLWVKRALRIEPSLAWLGTGLLTPDKSLRQRSFERALALIRR
jgi:hypothetical protein